MARRKSKAAASKDAAVKVKEVSQATEPLVETEAATAAHDANDANDDIYIIMHSTVEMADGVQYDKGARVSAATLRGEGDAELQDSRLERYLNAGSVVKA